MGRLDPKGVDARLFVSAACICARAAAQVALRPDYRAPANQDRLDGYKREAVELVLLALRQVSRPDRGPFWRKNIKGEAALDMIRNHPAMLDLAAKYNQ